MYLICEHKLWLKTNNLLLQIFLMFCIFTEFNRVNGGNGGNGDRIKSKIYESIESKHFCFRRLNGSHQIGCNTKESGNVGVVYLIKSEEDMTHVLKSGGQSPYMAVITPKDFNLKTLVRFKESSDRISGLLIVDFDEKNRTELKFLSSDKSCPNENFDLYVNDSTYGHCRQQEWNAEDNQHNEGLMFYDWPFPIFLITNQSQVNSIKECFSRFGGPDWPLCAIQLEAPMNAAKDSVTCLRRSAYSRNSYSLTQTLFCDPLGGHNIITTLLETSRNESINNKSIVVLSARLDSFSMFDNISPGADSALTSVVTLLSVADTLNKIKTEIRQKSDKKNLLFGLFDGEAFDYIGSSRVAYDMSAGMFPFDPELGIDLAQIRSHHFSHFIELSQLADHNSDNKLWIHKNDIKSQSLVDVIKESAQGSDLIVSSIDSKQALPPASLQTFLKKEPTLTGVVVTNHRNEFSNKFYNSFYDDFNYNNESDSKLSKRLTQISTIISKTIFMLLTNQSNPSIEANETLVKDLLYCYLRSPACPLFRYVSPDLTFSSQTMEPLPTYVGVFNSLSLSYTSRLLTHKSLVYLTGDIVTKSKSQCPQTNESQGNSFYWMTSGSDGICVRSQAKRLSAISPAFSDNGLDGVIRDSHLYSTWTESQWKSVTARMFLMPSALQQWLTLITGLIVLLLSFLFVYFLDMKSQLIFNQNNDIFGEQTLAVGC